MHIGMLTACYEPVINGVTQMVAQYERHLTANGHQVTIFTLGEPAAGEDFSKVIRSPALPLGNTGYHFAPRYSRQAQLRVREVDVIHCHHLLMGLEFANRYGSRPVVFTNHTRYDLYLSAYTHLPTSAANHVMRYAWRRMSNYADVFIAPSASAGQILRSAGVRAPVEVIENGIDIQRFRNPQRTSSRAEFGIPETAVIFTYVGRLAAEKNLRRLVTEFQQAVRSVDDVYLMLVGEGPMRGALERQIAAGGLTNRVRFVGRAAPEEVPALLCISDVFVSASLSEVHPLTVIEALAAGLPIVAIDAPGIGDVVEHQRSGLLADSSPGSLAEAISCLAKDRSYRRRLSAGAEAAASNYDIRITVERTLSLYRRLLRGQSDRQSAKMARSGITARPRPTLAGRFLSSGLFGRVRGECGDGQ